MSPDPEDPTPPVPPAGPAPVAEPLGEAEEDSPEPANALSPAVRRLVRQFDLDVTGIHGTGPSGRIRVGDVIAALGGREEPVHDRSNDPARTIPAADDPLEEPSADTPYRTSPFAASIGVPIERAQADTFPTSSVFECDLSRVLAHRKRQRRQNVEILLTSYYLVACSEALKLVPEVTATTSGHRPVHLGVILSSPDGHSRTVVVDAAEDSPLGSIDDRLRTLDSALRAVDAAQDLRLASLLIHHHGLSGSLIAMPTPIGEGHSASLGLGRVRRQIVVRATAGDETPKIAALCYVSLSFYPDQLALPRANRFLGQFVRVLEQWPE
jgi:pyruvate/2-oxoglutarate dehydrogenase complex dihydrolipoamide acyltransferase (E2) component